MAENVRTVLIITYYWPPIGGSGVQRWLKFVKYLPEYGWKPIVFTPENPSFAIRDESLLRDVPPEAEVVQFPIWEPYEAFSKLSGLLSRKKSLKPTDLVTNKGGGLFQKIAMWVRGNFFVPDPRVFWVRPSVRYLIDYIERKNIRTIITTGPPHSIHLIGLRLKEKNPNLRWLADFRDPWSEWGLLDSLKVGQRARRHHRNLENQVLRKADEIITITPFYKRRFEQLSGRNVTLLTNGFDEEDFLQHTVSRPQPFSVGMDGKVEYWRSDISRYFFIRHVGTINEKVDPRPALSAIEGLANADPDFKNSARVEFIGEVHSQFKAFVHQSPTLSSIVSFPGSLTHDDLLTCYPTSSVLLLLLTGYKDAVGYMPGKLFEYLAAGIPILCVGPTDGDAAALIRETNSGETFEGSQPEPIQSFLAGVFAKWKRGERNPSVGRADHPYSRRVITQQLARLLDQEMP